MITLTFESSAVKVKSGKSARTGKDYAIREQLCVAHGVERFPVETRIPLPDDVQPYEPGVYEVTTPLAIGRFGFDVRRDLGLKLVKQQPAAAKV
jgi:hypothetical protein